MWKINHFKSQLDEYIYQCLMVDCDEVVCRIIKVYFSHHTIHWKNESQLFHNSFHRTRGRERERERRKFQFILFTSKDGSSRMNVFFSYSRRASFSQSYNKFICSREKDNHDLILSHDLLSYFYELMVEYKIFSKISLIASQFDTWNLQPPVAAWLVT